MADEDDGRDKDAQNGQADVPVQLFGYDLVRFPSGITLRQGEYFSGQICFSDDSFHSIHGRDVFAGSAEQLVSESDITQQNI